ncbi:MAG: hypothetical protein AAFZ63_29515, partial [Bacteroidota bacterium]
MTYSFDPASAGVGVETLSYTVNSMTASDDIEVFATGTATFTAPADLCIDAGTLTNLGGGMPAGGTYSGSGVTDNGDGTYDFNPALAGLGVHTITYTSPGNCAGSATDDVEVLAACGCTVGTTFFYCYGNNETNLVAFEICPSAGEFARATIDQGTIDQLGDNLTVYQGVTGSGSSGTSVFISTSNDLSGNVISGTVADECLIFVFNSDDDESCAQGSELPLRVCGESFNGVSFTALDDLSINSGVQTGLSGGFPTGGVYGGPGVTDDGNGMTYTFDPVAAGLGIHTLTYTLSGVTATDDVQVLNLTPPSFSKSFNSNNIGPGSVSALTFTIDNSGSGTAAEDLAFVDNLPAGMTVASVPGVTSTCGISAVITATAGSSTISLTDGIIVAGGNCAISVNVTSSTVGTHTNTTGDLTSNLGNSGTASANLQVLDNRPGFSKSFSPASIELGGRSTLTFTIDNSANTV